jgi:hypothetical protein
VDREGRIIRGYSVITRGEALGWGMWVDGEFLDQVVAAGNAKASGLKTRFTHPGLCSDGLGKFLGRTRNLRRDGDQVHGDLHLADVGSTGPEGDLAGYVMDLAEEDPAAFAASIVFWHDIGAEDRFLAEHEDEEGRFVSPDAANVNNYYHCRLSRLDASDIVDEPAANAGGFFTRMEQGLLAEQADRWADWALGMSARPPEDVALGAGIESERAREWFNGYLARRGLQVVRVESGGTVPLVGSGPPNKEKTMPDEKKDAAQEAAALQKAKEEGQKAERERFARLEAKFGDRPGFVSEQYRLGHDVPEAEVALKDVLLAEKDEEIERLKKAPEKPAAGSGPATHTEQPDDGQGPGFFGLVSQYQEAHAGMSRGAAMIEVSRLHPKLADGVCTPAGRSVAG